MTMFRREGERYFAQLSPPEAQILRQCVAELATLLSDQADPDDPAVERLFPDAYPEDPQEAAEFRRLTEADLRSEKISYARSVLEMLSRGGLASGGGVVELDEEAADQWLRTLTDVRLALGTRLGVDDDTDVQAELDAAVGRSPSSPRVGQLSVYAYLSYLQESLVGALMG